MKAGAGRRAADGDGELVFNTNEEQGQAEIAFAALSGTEGISFLSPTKKFYG